MTVDRIEANGLTMELAPRRLSGRLIGGWYLRGVVAVMVQVPALALGMLVLLPTAWSVAVVVFAPRYRFVAVCCAAVVCAVWTWRRLASPSGSEGEAQQTDRWVPRRPELCVWLVWLVGVAWAGIDFGSRGNWGWSEVAGAGAVLIGVWWWAARRWRGHWYWAASLPAAVAAAGVIAAIVATEGSEAYWMTLVWVVATFGLLVFTVWMAWLLRRTWWPWWPLIVPFGVSAFVAGLAWRLIFEPIVDPVTNVGFQAFLYALMLGAAFAWIWFGALFVLLRAAAASIDSDPVRRAYLERRTGVRRYWRLVVMLNPVIMIAGLVVTVAAARVFDIILVGVPGPQQYTLDSVTVHWWHLPSDTAADHVAAAAFSLPLALVVGVVAWFLQVGIRRHHARWPGPGVVAVPVRLRIPVPARTGAGPRLAAHEMWILKRVRTVTGRIETGWTVLRAAIGGGVGQLVASRSAAVKKPVAREDPPPGTSSAERLLVTVVRACRLCVRIGVALLAALGPLAVLFVMTWAGFDGPALIGPKSIWSDAELWRGLMDTGVVAVVATFLTVSAALPPAYYAATLRPDKVPSRVLMTFLVVFAVLPAQIYLGPIRAIINRLDLAGTSIPLILMHAAIGLPIAIMILRGALLAPADGPLSDTRREPASTSIMVRSVLHSAGPALVAVAVLQLVQVWNDFFIGLQVRGADASPWSLLLWSDARQFHESTAHLAAGALLSAVPPVILLLATWRRFLVPGLTGGALR
ncbi:hypothetical protein [Nocardia vaccinii]|uniref:hypothetical protein n=1 Tax=Nocardia vaccinii TaxID=1822 RepID=UPI000835713C|nr:hypothetical protein [Nocardia vaccinii]